VKLDLDIFWRKCVAQINNTRPRWIEWLLFLFIIFHIFQLNKQLAENTKYILFNLL